jgi:hypothetical protein
MQKQAIHLLFLSIIFFTCRVSFAQEYTLANWLDNREAAVSLTFDDWSLGQQILAVPELNKRQIKATFFINGQSDYYKLIALPKQGHEIGNHTVSHLDITTLNAEKFNAEIYYFQREINKNIPSQQCVTFAYPFGAGANKQNFVDSIKKTHIAARGVWQITNANDPRLQYDFAKTENDYFNTNVVAVSKDSAFYAKMLDNVIDGGGHISFLYHSFDQGGYDFISMTKFKQQLNSLKQRKDKIWLTIYSNAMRYHREKNCASLTELAAPFDEKNTWKLSLTDTLTNNTVFNQPLTINLQVPSNVKSIKTISQNGKQIEFKLTVNTIIFNAIPDNGVILLSIR